MRYPTVTLVVRLRERTGTDALGNDEWSLGDGVSVGGCLLEPGTPSGLAESRQRAWRWTQRPTSRPATWLTCAAPWSRPPTGDGTGSWETPCPSPPGLCRGRGTGRSRSGRLMPCSVRYRPNGSFARSVMGGALSPARLSRRRPRGSGRRRTPCTVPPATACVWARGARGPTPSSTRGTPTPSTPTGSTTRFSRRWGGDWRRSTRSRWLSPGRQGSWGPGRGPTRQQPRRTSSASWSGRAGSQQIQPSSFGCWVLFGLLCALPCLGRAGFRQVKRTGEHHDSRISQSRYRPR